MMEPTVALLMAKVIPAARNYHEAEYALTFAFNRYYDESRCRSEADTAKRRATEVAIEIDGLADRAARALGLTADIVRSQVGQMSAIRGVPRDRCVDRVRAVAYAYRHPMRFSRDILVVGPGFGIDSYGMGKFSGLEVMVYQEGDTKRKFLADVPHSIAGWFTFLRSHSANLPTSRIIVCGIGVHPQCRMCGGRGYHETGDNVPGMCAPKPIKLRCVQCNGTGYEKLAAEYGNGR